MKRNIKLFTAILAVLLVAGATIFYACDKDNSVSNIDNNLTKEASFVAKNYDDMCVQVTIYRDEDGNAHFATKDIANDPEVAVRCIVPDVLNIVSQKRKSDGKLVMEIPTNGTYWLVPLDGHEPVKFEPAKDAKLLSTGTITYYCTCNEGNGGVKDSDCKVEKTQSKVECVVKPEATICTKCHLHTTCSVMSGSLSTVTLVGSSYLVQSNFISVNGLRYE